MRRLAEKVALVAQICITLVFVVTTLLYMSNVIPENTALANNGILATLIIILSIIYGLLSVYLVYMNFSERENLRQILLYSDSESATHANAKVIRNIVRSCARKVKGVRIRKAKMRLDEKQGFVVTLKIDVNAHYVSHAIDKLRCLIADSFKNTLGLTCNSINFEIRRLKSRYKPDVEKAEKLAKTLTEQRELSSDIYEQPFQDNCEACKNKNEEMDNDKRNIADDVKELRERLAENGEKGLTNEEELNLEQLDDDTADGDNDYSAE